MYSLNTHYSVTFTWISTDRRRGGVTASEDRRDRDNRRSRQHNRRNFQTRESNTAGRACTNRGRSIESTGQNPRGTNHRGRKINLLTQMASGSQQYFTRTNVSVQTEYKPYTLFNYSCRYVFISFSFIVAPVVWIVFSCTFHNCSSWNILYAYINFVKCN